MYLEDSYNISSATPAYTDPTGGDIGSPTYFKVMDQPIQEDIGILSYSTEYGFLKLTFDVPANPQFI